MSAGNGTWGVQLLVAFRQRRQQPFGLVRREREHCRLLRQRPLGDHRRGSANRRRHQLRRQRLHPQRRHDRFGNAANSTITVNQSATINSAISVASSNGQFVVQTTTGAGTLYLSNAGNGFANSAGILLQGGTLNFTAGALNNGSAGVPLLNCNGGTLQWAAGNTQDVSGSIKIGAAGQTACLNSNGNSVSFNSPLTGAGGLTKLGGGQLYLGNNNAAYSYSGNTTISGGTLALGSQYGLPNSTVVLAGGCLNTNGNGFIGGLSGSGTLVVDIPPIPIPAATATGLADSGWGTTIPSLPSAATSSAQVPAAATGGCFTALAHSART